MTIHYFRKENNNEAFIDEDRASLYIFMSAPSLNGLKPDVCVFRIICYQMILCIMIFAVAI